MAHIPRLRICECCRIKETEMMLANKKPPLPFRYFTGTVSVPLLMLRTGRISANGTVSVPLPNFHRYRFRTPSSIQVVVGFSGCLHSALNGVSGAPKEINFLTRQKRVSTALEKTNT